MNQAEIFPADPRKRRYFKRSTQEMVDAGYIDGIGDVAHFICKKCGADNGWYSYHHPKEKRPLCPCQGGDVGAMAPDPAGPIYRQPLNIEHIAADVNKRGDS